MEESCEDNLLTLKNIGYGESLDDLIEKMS